MSNTESVSASDNDWGRRLRKTTARENSATFTNKRKPRHCWSCNETLVPSHFPSLKPTARCSHDINHCLNCLQAWLKGQMQFNFWDHLRCPQCHLFLNFKEVKIAMDEETFEKYETIATRSTLSSQPGWRWCLQTGCESGQVFFPANEVTVTNPKKKPRSTRSGAVLVSSPDPPKDDVAFTCVKCGLATCTLCDKPWHEGETCSEHRKSLQKEVEEVKKSEQTIKEIGKNCPGEGCGKWIERNGGCPHMQCLVCHTDFCWFCLGVFKGSTGNPHKPGCTQN